MKSQLKFRYLSKKEEEQTVIKILDTLLDSSIPFSGEHRKTQWEKGWGENAKAHDLTPRYFGKHKVNRLNGRFVLGLSPGYEQNMLYTLVDSLSKKYLSDKEVICEFGCGTGHNLHRIKKVVPEARTIGLDWTESSQKILKQYDMEGYNFDFFNPHFNMPKGSGVITVAALEQTGKKYKRFVSFLLKKKPSVVVHIEPMPEYLDPTKLIDYLSIKYMEKRHYLSGYSDYIHELEKQGKVKIFESRRSGIGSLYIDGYSILVWRPI